MSRNIALANLITLRSYSTHKATTTCTKATDDYCHITSGLREFGFGRPGVKKGSNAAEVMRTLNKTKKLSKGSPYSHCQSAGARAEVINSAGKYLSQLLLVFKGKFGVKNGGGKKE